MPTPPPPLPLKPSLRKPKISSPAKESLPEKIRAELNIEKWPAIWQPAKSKNKPTVKTLQREINLEGGTRSVSKLEVGFTQLGNLTTEDQKTFYALIKQWEDSGKPEAQVFFSDRLLQRILKKKWGTNVIETITCSLRKLRTTPFTWTQSYHKAAQPKTIFEEETFFTLLSDLKIVRKKTDGRVTKQAGYFQFDKNILGNLLANYTKPLLLDDLFRFESETAQLLYVHIDLMLAKKNTYERRTKELFDDLGLVNKSYRNPSNRVQALNRALKELQGVRISTGMLKTAMVGKTRDEKDYKVIFRKVPATEEALIAADRTVTAAPPSEGGAETAANHSAAKNGLVVQAEDLLLHFYKLFHGVEKHDPQPKELSQALSLITQHGLEPARYVIQFAHRCARETSFHIQTFGGIMQYTSRALADLGRHKFMQERARRRQIEETEQLRREKEIQALGEARLKALTPEQYQRRFERAKNELFTRYPFMALQKDGSTLHQDSIKAKMISDLVREPND